MIKTKPLSELVDGVSLTSHVCKLLFFKSNLSLQLFMSLFNLSSLFLSGRSQIILTPLVVALVRLGASAVWTILFARVPECSWFVLS